MIRSIFVGFVTWLFVYPFSELYLYNLSILLIYTLLGSTLLALLGLIAGIWAEKFDNMSGITNFIITPLTFLSGTFYTIDKLPEPFFTISLFNPFYYIIDGFRYGFLGAADGSIKFGLIYLTIISVILWFVAFYLFRIGYKIKS